MHLGIFLTARCNAACTHCATSCGPRRTEAFSRDQIFALMDQAAAANEDDWLELSLSGGEPFLDFPLLLDVVAHGSALGAIVSCQSNGYWAVSEAAAVDRLRALKDAGLDSLGLSVSVFHEAFVKRERVLRALRAAQTIGLRVALKCARTHDAAGEALERWARAAGADDLEVFPVHPYLRADAGAQPADCFSPQETLPTGVCPAAVMTLREDGAAYTCCAPGGFNDFLRLGSVDDGVAALQERFLMQGRQQLLRRHGPVHFARAAIARGLGARLRTDYADVCDLCCHIGRDPELAALAAAVASEYEVAQLRALFGRLEAVEGLTE